MKVSVLVCTYGSPEWKLRGAATASDVDAHEVIALHEPNATLAEVRNLAAAAATSDWLCFLDADDSLDLGYVGAMQDAIQEARQWHPFVEGEAPPYSDPSNLYVPAVSFVSAEGRCSEPTIPAWDRLIYDVNCAVIGTLIPRGLFMQVGGFHEWSAYEDWELWLRCIANGAKLVPVPAAVYCARAEDGTGRNTVKNHGVEYARIRARHMAVPAAVWAGAKTG